MASCRPAASPYWQLQQGDPYGSANCAAYAGAAAIAFETCGARTPTGRTIRAQSSEPIPDPASPGLNLAQLASVMIGQYGIAPAVHIDAPWQEFVDASMAGHGCVISIGYDPIRRSVYRGSRVFTGGHAFFEAQKLFTYDPLADGRLLGQGYRAFTGPAYYPAELLKTAAGQLPIPTSSGGIRRAGYGRVWYLRMPTAHPLTVTPPPGREEPLDATRQKPVAVCTVRAGGTVYADPDRHTVLYTAWGGGTRIQLYSRPTHPVQADGKAALAAIRIDKAGGPAEDLHVAYVGDDLISAVALA